MLFKKKIEVRVKEEPPIFNLYLCGGKKIIGMMKCMIKEDENAIMICDVQCCKNNRGYGSIIMSRLIEEAKTRGYDHIDGWLSGVDYGHVDRLHHFYQKFGFEIIPNEEGMKMADIKLEL